MMEWASGNIYIRQNRLEKTGDIIDGHEHNFDHTTIVFVGAVRVVKSRPILGASQGGPEHVIVAEKDFAAPAHFLVEANCHHSITALQDNTVLWCVYSHRDPKGAIIQDYNGWTDAYV